MRKGQATQTFPRECLARADGRFSSSPHHGDRGWLVIDLEDHNAVDWDEIAELLESGYRQVAPRTLIEE